MTNLADVSGAVVIKSDQINAEDFMGGLTMDIVITKVDYFQGKQQPLWIHSEGRQPFKPCTTMIKALMDIWGSDARPWPGRVLTLYRRDDVNFGSQKNIGGVRISHLSDMPNKSHEMMLTIRRGLKELHTFYRWEPTDYTQIINQWNSLTNKEDRDSMWNSITEPQRTAINNQPTQGA